MKVNFLCSALALVLVSGTAAQAAPVLSSVSGPGWTTDRYEPASWETVANYQGRDNVLRIGIDDSTNASARPGGQQGTFYNTQGRQIGAVGGVGDSLSADLFLDSSWANSGAGLVRTDLWGRAGGAENETTYTIFGFTNQGGAGDRLRIFDANVSGGWVDVLSDLSGLYNTWVSLEIMALADGYGYYLNDALVYTDTTLGSAGGGFTKGYLQAYNWNDPALGITGNAAYNVHWSDPQGNAVPLPGTLALASLSLFLLGAPRMQRHFKAQHRARRSNSLRYLATVQ